MIITNRRVNQCPINLYGEREYYLEKLKRTCYQIKKQFLLEQKEENDSATRARRNVGKYNRKPHEVMHCVDTSGFYLGAMPSHSEDEKYKWLSAIFGKVVTQNDSLN